MRYVYQATLLLLFATTSLTGCFSNHGTATFNTTSSSDSTTATVVENTGASFTISNATINNAGSSVTQIFFNIATSTAELTPNYCDTGSKLCSCQYEWTEINTNNGNVVPINRSTTSTATTVDNYSVECETPSVYTSEIADGTAVKVTLVPQTGNNSGFTVTNKYQIFKGNDGGSGDFFDSEGRAFTNIKRYSCFEKVQKGLTLKSKVKAETNTETNETKNVLLGTQFCTHENNGSGCEDVITDNDFGPSAQSYYYNLYIKSDMGGYNNENENYFCPRVLEPIAGGTAPGVEGSPWPLDATFALANSPGEDFSVGVESPSVLGLAGDSTSDSTSCFTGSSSAANSNSISKKCLGYALKPNSNGTCPHFLDSDGIIRFTFRLRRFVAQYPPHFQASGSIVQQGNAIDTVYVLDRPVNSVDPFTPFTMTGPKPCNFAYNLKGHPDQSNPNIYHATNSPLMSANDLGINVDGIHFPNRDIFGNLAAGVNSCAVTFPLVEYDQENPTGVYLSTSASTDVYGTAGIDNTRNYQVGIDVYNGSAAINLPLEEVWVRPQKAWYPQYVEDTSFQACAPLADPFIDAPLHFARHPVSGDMGYCAESYPTQNVSTELLDPLNLGYNGGGIKIWTSHVSKQSISGACTATEPDNYHLGAFGAECDRTVVNAGSLSTAKYPLLAEETDVEAMIRDYGDMTNLSKQDAINSYYCTVTYDGGLGKEGLNPSGENLSNRCCQAGAVAVTVGNPEAHLEPSPLSAQQCGIPNY